MQDEAKVEKGPGTPGKATSELSPDQEAKVEKSGGSLNETAGVLSLDEITQLTAGGMGLLAARCTFRVLPLFRPNDRWKASAAMQFQTPWVLATLAARTVLGQDVKKEIWIALARGAEKLLAGNVGPEANSAAATGLAITFIRLEQPNEAVQMVKFCVDESVKSPQAFKESGGTPLAPDPVLAAIHQDYERLSALGDNAESSNFLEVLDSPLWLPETHFPYEESLLDLWKHELTHPDVIDMHRFYAELVGESRYDWANVKGFQEWLEKSREEQAWEVDPPAMPHQTTSQSVQAAFAYDQPSDVDTLGFQPYVEAVATFLANPETRAPLAMSVEGEWGVGKTSYMRQLEKQLGSDYEEHRWGFRKRLKTKLVQSRQCFVRGFRKLTRKKGFRQTAGKSESPPQRPLTVWFNAWRHDKEDSLWAAFGTVFIREIKKTQSWTRRMMAKTKLLWLQFEWSSWPSFLREFWILLAWGAAIAFVVYLPFSDIVRDWMKESTGADESLLTAMARFLLGEHQWWGQWVVPILVAIPFFRRILKTIGNPLEVNLQQYFRSPNWSQRVVFIEQFHRDFKRIVRALVGERKVFVFVDDLDRCDIPKSAELMQAFNLLINDDPSLVFILGMDRGKVAAGLTVKFKKIIPYVIPAAAKVDPSGRQIIDPARATRFGHDYLEKFIQIRFHVPGPTKFDYRKLIGLPPRAQEFQPAPTVTSGNLDKETTKYLESELKDLVDGGADSLIKHIRQSSLKRVEVQLADDSATVENVVRLVAPTLEKNPRRIKQFINDFRMQAYIQASFGSLRDEAEAEQADLTLSKLAKFITIRMRWPRLARNVDDSPELLNWLQSAALKRGHDGTDNKLFKRWQDEPDFPQLLQLLRRGCDQDYYPAREQAASLAELNVRNLLDVTPTGDSQ